MQRNKMEWAFMQNKLIDYRGITWKTHFMYKTLIEIGKHIYVKVIYVGQGLRFNKNQSALLKPYCMSIMSR